MKKIFFLLPVLFFLLSILFFNSCKKKDDPLKTKALTHNITVNWFRDSSTSNPAAFIDFYNGTAYTQANAAIHAGSTDAFCYDHGALPVSFSEVDFINMTDFGNNTSFDSHDAFNNVVGIIPFSTYTSSTFAELSITPAEFNNIQYNDDIASLFSSKNLNGGYADMKISSSDLTTTTKYYQFRCSSNGKRGFFHVTSANYLPGGTMTIEVKVEQ